MNVRAVHLYRNILKIHRKLPDKIRVLGDQYVKNEFQLHKNVTSNEKLDIFFQAWTKYLNTVTGTVLKAPYTKGVGFGRDLNDEERQALSGEQKQKLDQLSKELRKSKTS